MRVRALLASVAMAALLVPPVPARAALVEVSVGNYYFEDDATGGREIVVRKGDQIRFTVRDAAYPPHSAKVDELGIASGDMLLFDTYTTPPIGTVGTFRLYCEAHQDRGHETTLTVKKSAEANEPSKGPSKGAGGGGDGGQREQTNERPAASKKNKRPSGKNEPIIPSGKGIAEDRTQAPVDPRSLEGVLGRRIGGDLPWTVAVKQALLLLVPIALVTGFAVRRHLGRERAPRDGVLDEGTDEVEDETLTGIVPVRQDQTTGV